jgi:ACS family hexuronate transporter-like MFS transporter
MGEAGNWPGATKAVGEWFPRKERGWAVALFDSGSSVGAAVAPFIVLGIYHYFGGWRPAFFLTACLGWIWLAIWRRSYYPPDEHPTLSAEERETILADRREEEGEERQDQASAAATNPSRLGLLGIPQTWGVVLGRSLTDPTWFMVTDWFAIYLVSRGFKLEDTLAGFWVPFLAADLGNFFGGGCSSALIARGWPVGRARKIVIAVMGVGMLMLIPAAFATSFPVLIGCFAIATFSYAAWSTMILALPADLFRRHAVATVAGMSGAGAGLGTIVSTFLIGFIADRFSFAPILIGGSLVPLLATFIVLMLVRNNRHSGGALVRRI